MRKPSQFFRYSLIYFMFPRIEDILHYKNKDLSFEQFSRVIVQYFKEHNIDAFIDSSPNDPFFSQSLKQLYESFLSWWDELSENKKNLIVSCGISMTDWMHKKICPRCESGTLRRGKAQKVEKEWKYPITCSNKQCSLHNNTELGLEP